MDRVRYPPGWVERDRREKDRLTREVHARDRWIFEGGRSRTCAGRIARADTPVRRDLPAGVRMRRVLRRAVVGRGRSRVDLPEGRLARFDWRIVGFLRFVRRTRETARAPLEAVFRDPPPHLATARLRTRAQAQAFLDALEVTSGR